MVRQVAKSDNKWQRMIQEKYFSDHSFRYWQFLLFLIIKYPIINISASASIFFRSSHRRCSVTYTSSYNLTPAISRVLIGEHLIFCSPPWPTCCNSPRKCTPVKYKARQKTGFQLSHTHSCKKRCSQKFRKIYRKTTASESLF